MLDLQVFGHRSPIYKNRQYAGRKLAKQLIVYQGSSPIIIALPRGGVVVGYEVSNKLDIPMDVMIVRKIGAPYNQELGIGAISENDVCIIDSPTVKQLGVEEREIDKTIIKERLEMERRIKMYRESNSLPQLHHRTVIMVDDGLATGVTAQAAIKAVLKLHPRELIFAVPVCAYDTAQTIRIQVDEFICPYCPYEMNAIGFYYNDFGQVTDGEVISLLQKAKNSFNKKIYEKP